MYPQEYETLTYEICNKFRKYLRYIAVDIQDVCYSYRDEKDRDLSFWMSSTIEIDSTIRNFLFIEKFADYRKPIEAFKDKFEQFSQNLKAKKHDLLNEIIFQLKEIDNSDVKNLLTNIAFEDDKKWSDIDKTLRKMKNKKEITLELYQKSFDSSIRGKAISHIMSVIKELNNFYESMPKVMTMDEQKIYVLQRENDKLTKQNKVKDTQIRQLQNEKTRMQSRLDSEIKTHNDDLRKADVQLTGQKEKEKEYIEKIKELQEELAKYKNQLSQYEQEKATNDDLFKEILLISLDKNC